jgi:hypothetical protein
MAPYISSPLCSLLVDPSTGSGQAANGLCIHRVSSQRLKPVRPGEPRSIWRTIPPVIVNGNARWHMPPGVFISYCCQRVTTIPPPAPALWSSQPRLWGAKATNTVVPIGRKNIRELSDSLVNNPSRVNRTVAFGTSSVFELFCERRRVRCSCCASHFFLLLDLITVSSFLPACASMENSVLMKR